MQANMNIYSWIYPGRESISETAGDQRQYWCDSDAVVKVVCPTVTAPLVGKLCNSLLSDTVLLRSILTQKLVSHRLPS